MTINSEAFPDRLQVLDKDKKMQFGDIYWLATMQMVDVLDWMKSSEEIQTISYTNMLGYLTLNFGISHDAVADGAFSIYESDTRLAEERDRQRGMLKYSQAIGGLALPMERIILNTSTLARSEHTQSVADRLARLGLDYHLVESHDNRRHPCQPALLPLDGWRLRYEGREHTSSGHTWHEEVGESIRTRTAYEATDNVLLYKDHLHEAYRITLISSNRQLHSDYETKVVRTRVQGVEFW